MTISKNDSPGLGDEDEDNFGSGVDHYSLGGGSSTLYGNTTSEFDDEDDNDYEEEDDDDDDDFFDDPEIDQKDAWAVIGSFFKTKGLVQHHLESFNNFLSEIPKIIGGPLGVIKHTQKVASKDFSKPTFDEIPEKEFVFEFDGRKLEYQPPMFTEVGGLRDYISPQQARLRNLNYSCSIYCSARITCKESKKDKEGETVEMDEIYLGDIPIMLRSHWCRLNTYREKAREEGRDEEIEAIHHGECAYDPGGYFIINGSEKAVVAQERISQNDIFCFKQKATNKYSWKCEIRAQKPNDETPSKFNINMLDGKRNIDANVILGQMGILKQEMNVIIFFKALGTIGDQQIISHILYDMKDFEMANLFRPTLMQFTDEYNRKYDFKENKSLIQIQRYSIGGDSAIPERERLKLGRQILAEKFLPQLGRKSQDNKKKVYFLGYAIHKLLTCALGRSGEDDRDHYSKKRLDLVGNLMTDLFRLKFKQLKEETRKIFEKDVDSKGNFGSVKAIKAATITDGLRYSLATGNWGDQKTATKKGIAQVLSRLTFASSLSLLRRINTPLDKTAKNPKPRQLHSSHWGMVCPVETPEGQQVGLVKNLALMIHISVGQNTLSDEALMNALNMQNLESCDEILSPEILAQPEATKVFVNGVWEGINRQPDTLCRALLQDRRAGNLNADISIVHDIADKTIRIYTDSGRVLRPLYIVQRNEQQNSSLDLNSNTQKLAIRKRHIELITKRDDDDFHFDHLLEKGLIEYIDTEEEETCMIAMYPSDLKAGKIETYTHCEIHPAMVFGVCASIIPFSDHNPAVRNTYQSAMGKQAMGIYASNFPLRMDSSGHSLCYPQWPLANTRQAEYLYYRELPPGTNAIVAIMCYSGYNQEDSLIFNQSAIDRGFFRSSFTRVYNSQCERSSGLGGTFVERFAKPDPSNTVALKKDSQGGLSHYDKLDIDGLPCIGERVSGDDILIGKVAPTFNKRGNASFNDSQIIEQDVSTPMRSTEAGRIDQVLLTTTGSGFAFAKVRIHNIRVPQIGDKFSARHGQKGTIGMTYRQEDMPFTSQGITPDIILNPHAIPSRMTIAQLIECLASKVGALDGTESDATVFNTEVTAKTIGDMLHKLSFQRHGNEMLHSGMTGKQLKERIFIGPTFYQRLKHLVDDKIHSRSFGPVAASTRQPLEGRARGGGLRMGEMERDCLVAHGAAAFIRDRFFLNSDKYRVTVCDICGMIAAEANEENGSYHCRTCSNSFRFSQLEIPYACKLLFQELISMCIAPRLFTQHSGMQPEALDFVGDFYS